VPGKTSRVGCVSQEDRTNRHLQALRDRRLESRSDDLIRGAHGQTLLSIAWSSCFRGMASRPCGADLVHVSFSRLRKTEAVWIRQIRTPALALRICYELNRHPRAMHVHDEVLSGFGDVKTKQVLQAPVRAVSTWHSHTPYFAFFCWQRSRVTIRGPVPKVAQKLPCAESRGDRLGADPPWFPAVGRHSAALR
jgi:hypothetical protein